jgi:hypothetical protein
LLPAKWFPQTNSFGTPGLDGAKVSVVERALWPVARNDIFAGAAIFWHTRAYRHYSFLTTNKSSGSPHRGPFRHMGMDRVRAIAYCVVINIIRGP